MQDFKSDQNESGLQDESIWQRERSLGCNLHKMLSIEKVIDYQRKFNKWDKMTNIEEVKFFEK